MPDPNVLTDTTTQALLSEFFSQINYRLDLLEKRTADIATQNEYILYALRNLNSRKATFEEPPAFYFNPIEREEELTKLELQLADNNYRSKMVKWLRVNCTGDCAENRMLGILDMLISKKMQTQCTWTGASRLGPKLAIMPNRNILQLFQEIGSDDLEVVTQQKLASFFMKKLKNSLKRLVATGERRGTRHVRKKATNNLTSGSKISSCAKRCYLRPARKT
ncbi:uncharacterized protein LOC129728524 [Wyeomyia smithii]|uniref:uncharacterized protein LOC129728524 n=1 Tax=Wyeomyia smithii TaxID=174621 RepID=UPI002467C8F1|nr:uncharacterized protein LOC129728524 [Wyeomyia smithii]